MRVYYLVLASCLLAATHGSEAAPITRDMPRGPAAAHHAAVVKTASELDAVTEAPASGQAQWSPLRADSGQVSAHDAAQTVGTTAAPEDYIAYYPLDVNAEDAGPRGYDGAATATQVFDPFTVGTKGGCANLTRGDDRIVFNGNIGINQQSYTVSLWFKMNSYRRHSVVWNKYDNGDKTAFRIRISETSGLEFARLNYNSTDVGLVQTGPLQAQIWYHVVYVIDRANNTGSGYVNGRLVGVGDISQGGGWGNYATAMALGAYVTYPQPSNCVDGWVDEVKLYDRVLSEPEIIALTISGAQRSDPPLPVRWDGHPDGRTHYYELVVTDAAQTWEDARSQAESLSFKGLPGYLGSITSDAERDFLVANLLDGSYCGDAAWLGGYQDPITPPANSGWHWTSGEAWRYANWDSGEPNDATFTGGTEFLLEMYWNLTGKTNGKWNDLGTAGTRRAYLVEYSDLSPGLLDEGTTLIIR